MGLGTLITIFFAITFLPPVIFIVIGILKRGRNKRSANVYFILGVGWLLVGGGICASIMS